MTGDDLAALDEPRRGLGIFSPPRVSDDADELARMFGRAIGHHAIPEISRTKLGECVAVLVMYPEAEGTPASEVLAESQRRWSEPTIRAKLEDFAENHGTAERDRAMAVLREIMGGMLTALGDRKLPPEANHALVVAGAFISDRAARA